ncbi:SDR family NAD(P)-dependent oxidoreductase [Pseudorhodoferax sp.]|uniref:SDR family NAD(P)-dependent oxidoreductase n=1 Tax=Pseudorhodoferax sp. TaxID=1993553 RepID=UPI0039E67041
MSHPEKTKVAVVTGGASGIGRRTVERLLAEQWQVWALDVSQERLARMDQELGAGGHLRTLGCDVTDEAGVQRAFAAIRSATGGIDALVCSAGAIRPGPLTSHSAGDLDLMLAVNVKGPWLCVREALPALRLGASVEAPARIVFVGSVTGMMPKAGSGFYGATKSALHALASVFAVELAPSGITVNVVAPGTVDTPMRDQVLSASRASGYQTYGTSPLGRIARPDDVAGAVLYLLSDAARYVNGAVLPVDGGSRAALN